VGMSDNSKAHLRQAPGGPALPGHGRALCLHRARHEDRSQGPWITGSDWDLSVKALVATLDKFKVPQKEKDELLVIASSLKADIVEKP
jgi:hypothetical protein